MFCFMINSLNYILCSYLCILVYPSIVLLLAFYLLPIVCLFCMFSELEALIWFSFIFMLLCPLWCTCYVCFFYRLLVTHVGGHLYDIIVLPLRMHKCLHLPTLHPILMGFSGFVVVLVYSSSFVFNKLSCENICWT